MLKMFDLVFAGQCGRISSFLFASNWFFLQCYDCFSTCSKRFCYNILQDHDGAEGGPPSSTEKVRVTCSKYLLYLHLYLSIRTWLPSNNFHLILKERN